MYIDLSKTQSASILFFLHLIKKKKKTYSLNTVLWHHLLEFRRQQSSYFSVDHPSSLPQTFFKLSIQPCCWIFEVFPTCFPAPPWHCFTLVNITYSLSLFYPETLILNDHFLLLEKFFCWRRDTRSLYFIGEAFCFQDLFSPTKDLF